MRIEHENTLKQVLGTGVNLFTGSGFSVLAKDRDGNPLPTGSQLAEELIRAFQVPHETELTLSQICTILEAGQRQKLRDYLKARFAVCEFDTRYLSLDKVNVKNIFTVNIDDLLYQVYAHSAKHYLNDLDMRGPVLSDSQAVNMVTLHGCILDDGRDLSFGAISIASAFHSDPDRWHNLTDRLQAHPTLFWGTSISDSGTLEALNPKTIQSRPQKDKWAVLPDDSFAPYFQALGCQLIIATTSEMLDYLESLTTAPRPTMAQLRKQTTKSLFPSESMPEMGTVPMRPIIEFYMGAAPSWSDIASGQLHRTSHFASVIDSIHSGRDTIVIGIPSSGKTTLLMQIAYEILFDGHKLLLESPTPEKVRHMSNLLDGNEALVFVDNFADSADSFQLLIEQPNITAVGFDRDYNFINISDRIARDKCNVVGVTELTQPDIQAIIAKIPSRIVSPYVRTVGITEGPAPSLFELIESNTITPSLRERFRSVMQQLSEQSENLLDLMLVFCYVHSCRTPVSMDMLLAFFRDTISDYTDVYEMCDRLRPMISDYYGDFAVEEQDFWTPRSALVSEAALAQASSSSLKRVISEFVRQVSPSRIPKYDVFRRKAYDARLIARAFLSWAEGREFYETVYRRDDNYYILQQGALYLSHKKRFKEAFSWIEQSIILSGGRNLSIQNSHAVILFRANINLPSDDPTVRRTLHQSMDILSQCYTQDKRKTYHALTFADHALQYHQAYADSVAYGYLQTAKTWLKEERSNAPWHRGVRRLLTEVSDALSQTTA